MRGDFRIGKRLIRPQLNAIEDNETTLHLEPKVMQVLVTLASQAGNVVTRQQIREAVWQDVCVGDDVLVRAISELRRAFQDDPSTQHTIQTVPKVGYRLVVPVEAADEEAREAAAPPEEFSEVPQLLQDMDSSAVHERKELQAKGQKSLKWGLATATVVLILIALVAWFWTRGHREVNHATVAASSAAVSASATPSSTAAAHPDTNSSPRDRSASAVQGRCPLISGATYEIRNQQSGLVLEVPVSSLSNGTLLDQWGRNGGGNQLWVAEPSGPYWTFTNVRSQKRLDVPRADRAPGVQVDQWQATDAPNQNWIVLPVGDQSCVIISQVSGLQLDVDRGSTENGASVIQYMDNDGRNQHWIFRLVKRPNGTPKPH